MITRIIAVCWLISSLVFSAEPDKLILISPHWEGIQREYDRAFTAWYKQRTGREIKLEWLDQGGTSDDFRFIRSEFSRTPEGIGVDIFWGGGTDPYHYLSEARLLSPYKLPDSLLARIPATIFGVPMYAPDYGWYGTALSGFGILRNRVVTDMIKLPLARTWEDLADPALRTWVGGADPRSSGSAHMAYEVILQAYGWEKGWDVLTRIAANIKAFTKGSNQGPKDVAVGEVAYGLVIDLYAWTQILEVGRDRLDYVLPEGLTVINPDAIGILKGAPHPDAARLFVEYALSPAGQALLVLPKGDPDGPRDFTLGRMPVLPELYTTYAGRMLVKVNPFGYTKSFAYDSNTGSARWSIFNDLFGVMFIDLHKDMSRAWRLIIEKGCPDDLVRRLTAMPVSEKELMDLAGRWKDQELRNRTIAAWTTFAHDKYKTLIRELDR